MSERHVQRFRFLQPGVPITKLYCEFRHPRTILAAEDTVAESDPSTENELRILTRLSSGSQTIRVKSKTAEIAWRPGQASVVAPPELHDHLISALVEFAYYEGELSRLEGILSGRRDEAERDLQFAFQIRPRDAVHRERAIERMQIYVKLRLEFAQLGSFLHTPSGKVSPLSHRWLKKLLEKADIQSRVKIFGEELERRKALYEGASDRFTDFAVWADGHKVELIIVVILLLDFFVMITDLVLHLVAMSGRDA